MPQHDICPGLAELLECTSPSPPAPKAPAGSTCMLYILQKRMIAQQDNIAHSTSWPGLSCLCSPPCGSLCHPLNCFPLPYLSLPTRSLRLTQRVWATCCARKQTSLKQLPLLWPATTRVGWLNFSWAVSQTTAHTTATGRSSSCLQSEVTRLSVWLKQTHRQQCQQQQWRQQQCGGCGGRSSSRNGSSSSVTNSAHPTAAGQS